MAMRNNRREPGKSIQLRNGVCKTATYGAAASVVGKILPSIWKNWKKMCTARMKRL